MSFSWWGAVYNFPFQAKNDLLACALNKFGEVKDVFNHCCLHLSGVADGVRVVSMVRNQAIPRNLDVEGFRVKVSYYAQAVECDVDGLRDSLKRAALLQWLHAAPWVNVVCLQEVHCVSESECPFSFWSSRFSSCVSPASNRSCGSIALFRPSLSLVASWSDFEGRLLQYEFQFREVRFLGNFLVCPESEPAAK